MSLRHVSAADRLLSPSTSHPRATGQWRKLLVSVGIGKVVLNWYFRYTGWSGSWPSSPYKEGVGGSSPSAPTRKPAVQTDKLKPLVREWHGWEGAPSTNHPHGLGDLAAS